MNKGKGSISNKHFLLVFALLWDVNDSEEKEKLEYYHHIQEAHRKTIHRIAWKHWQQALSEFELLQTLILCLHTCKRFWIWIYLRCPPAYKIRLNLCFVAGTRNMGTLKENKTSKRIKYCFHTNFTTKEHSIKIVILNH